MCQKKTTTNQGKLFRDQGKFLFWLFCEKLKIPPTRFFFFCKLCVYVCVCVLNYELVDTNLSFQPNTNEPIYVVLCAGNVLKVMFFYLDSLPTKKNLPIFKRGMSLLNAKRAQCNHHSVCLCISGFKQGGGYLNPTFCQYQ